MRSTMFTGSSYHLIEAESAYDNTVLPYHTSCLPPLRTGRCGRAGKQGLAMNFANPDTKFVIRRFGKKLGIKVHDCEIRDGRVFLKMR